MRKRRVPIIFFSDTSPVVAMDKKKRRVQTRKRAPENRERFYENKTTNTPWGARVGGRVVESVPIYTYIMCLCLYEYIAYNTRV